MRKIIFLILLSFVIKGQLVQAASLELQILKEDPFSEQRLCHVLGERDQEKAPFPEFENIQDLISFLIADSKAEQIFWQDTQSTFRQGNKRLDIILRMVENAIARLPKPTSPFAASTIKCQTLLQIFSSNGGHEEDSFNYEIYKSYSEAIAYFKELEETLLPLQLKTRIKDVKGPLYDFLSQKKERYDFFKRIYTTSSVKEMDALLKETPEYFATDLGNLVLSSDIFFREVFDNYEKSHLESFPALQLASQKRKKKPQEKLRKNKGAQAQLQPKQKGDHPLNSRELILSPVSKTPPLVESSMEEITGSILDLQEEKEAPKVVNPDSEQAYHFLPDEVEAVLSRPREVEGFSLEPWKQYPEEKKQLSIESPKKEKSSKIEVDLESTETLRAFFSTEQMYREKNISMKEFLSTISKHFNGYVYRVGETLHFMAKSPDGKWYAYCPHVLHKDKHQYIPRNTPYWNSAKRFLENLGANELIGE